MTVVLDDPFCRTLTLLTSPSDRIIFILTRSVSLAVSAAQRFTEPAVVSTAPAGTRFSHSHNADHQHRACSRLDVHPVRIQPRLPIRNQLGGTPTYTSHAKRVRRRCDGSTGEQRRKCCQRSDKRPAAMLRGASRTGKVFDTRLAGSPQPHGQDALCHTAAAQPSDATR